MENQDISLITSGQLDNIIDKQNSMQLGVSIVNQKGEFLYFDKLTQQIFEDSDFYKKALKDQIVSLTPQVKLFKGNKGEIQYNILSASANRRALKFLGQLRLEQISQKKIKKYNSIKTNEDQLLYWSCLKTLKTTYIQFEFKDKFNCFSKLNVNFEMQISLNDKYYLLLTELSKIQIIEDSNLLKLGYPLLEDAHERFIKKMKKSLVGLDKSKIIKQVKNEK